VRKAEYRKLGTEVRIDKSVGKRKGRPRRAALSYTESRWIYGNAVRLALVPAAANVPVQFAAVAVLPYLVPGPDATSLIR
jgi:hypothetical protein